MEPRSVARAETVKLLGYVVMRTMRYPSSEIRISLRFANYVLSLIQHIVQCTGIAELLHTGREVLIHCKGDARSLTEKKRIKR